MEGLSTNKIILLIFGAVLFVWLGMKIDDYRHPALYDCHVVKESSADVNHRGEIECTRTDMVKK